MKSKILYGISGIGFGHTYRQLPIIEHFSRRAKMVIFAYGASYDFYAPYFKNLHNVKVLRVAVPFFAGNKSGLDFSATAISPQNRGQDFLTINCAALNQVSKILGKPDLVISDYEPTCAQYAYTKNVPLVTIDQQSKYLCGDFPAALHGYAYQDEIERLHMFFPRADARIACSFFRAPIKAGGDRVSVFPPIIKESVLKMRHNRLEHSDSILIYISSARKFIQSPAEIGRILTAQKNAHFHIFMHPADADILRKISSPIISVYKHGDKHFNDILQKCLGIVASAGHSLLSEAMYLGIPVYAIPVSPYEQHMNARIIEKNGFGMSSLRLTPKKLARFIKNIPRFRNAIKQDKTILLRGAGQEKIIRFLTRHFLSAAQHSE